MSEMEIVSEKSHVETLLVDKKEKHKAGAKNLSKIAQVLATVYIVTMSIVTGLGYLELDPSAILMFGFGIVAVWLPSFTSIVIDKIKDMKK